MPLSDIKLTAPQIYPTANLIKKKKDSHSERNKNVGRETNGIELEQITCKARGRFKKYPILCISGTVFFKST
jgi:hypothetical protein